MWQTRGPPGPPRPRWAPCWPQQPHYMGTNTLTLAWLLVSASDICSTTDFWNDASRLVLYSAKDVSFGTRFMRIKMIWKRSISFCQTLWSTWYWSFPNKRNKHKTQADHIFWFDLNSCNALNSRCGTVALNGSKHVFERDSLTDTSRCPVVLKFFTFIWHKADPGLKLEKPDFPMALWLGLKLEHDLLSIQCEIIIWWFIVIGPWGKNSVQLESTVQISIQSNESKVSSAQLPLFRLGHSVLLLLSRAHMTI